MYRGEEYWQEKADMMVDDYVPKLKKLIGKRACRDYTEALGSSALEYYLHMMEDADTDPLSEMTAREFTESMMQARLEGRLDSENAMRAKKNNSEDEGELILYLETEDGTTARVAESQLSEWSKGQALLKSRKAKGEKITAPAALKQRALQKLKERLHE